MPVVALPKSWLIHTIFYSELDGKDDYNNPMYKEPQKVEFVRVDHSTGFSRDANQQQIDYEAVIFIDAKHSKPLLDFKEESTISHKGKEYTIKRVTPFYQPDQDELRHIEMEVV